MGYRTPLLKQMYCLADLLRLRGVWCGVLNGSVASVEDRGSEPFREVSEWITGSKRAPDVSRNSEKAPFWLAGAHRMWLGGLRKRLDGVSGITASVMYEGELKEEAVGHLGLCPGPPLAAQGSG